MTQVASLPRGGATSGSNALPSDLAAENFANAILTLVIAGCITALPVYAHLLHPAFGVLSAALLAGICAWRMPSIAIVAIFFALLFQNLFVSLAADYVVSDDDFDIIRGYNFVVLSVTWLVVTATWLQDWRHRNRALDPFIRVLAVVFVVLGVYFLIGFALYGITAIIYLRNIVTPLLLFQICMMAFVRQPIRIGQAMTLLSVLVVICGFMEFFQRETWLDLTNGYAYWERSQGANYITMAYDETFEKTGIVPTGLLDSFVITLFNSPLLAEYDIQIMRLFGPNMHAISFAYALSFLATFAFYRGRILLTAVLFALLFLTSAKGPLILFLLVGLSWCMFRIFGARTAFACHCLALLAYAVVGIAVGSSIGDYHVIGLMGGLSEFLANPIGRGIGAGGNLSSEFINIDWPAAQAAGRTPFAVESAVGVLLSQTGIFGFTVIATYAWISWRTLLIAEKTRNDLHAAAALGLMAMVVTGLFQEEAYFAPLALATFMALAGMIIGASARTGLLDRPGNGFLRVPEPYTGDPSQVKPIMRHNKKPVRLLFIQTQAEMAGAQEISRLLGKGFAHEERIGEPEYEVHHLFFYRKTEAFDRWANVHFCRQNSPRNPVSLLVFFWNLYRAIRRINPDVLLTFQHYGNIFGAAAGRLAGVPLVIANHVSAPATISTAARATDLALGMMGAYDVITVNSNETWRNYQTYPARYRKHLTYVPHGFEDKSVEIGRQDARALFDLPAGVPLIGSVARLHPLKQLDAAIAILPGRPALHLAIAGQGPDEQRLRSIAEKLDVADRVHLIGDMPPQKIGLFLASLNAFVFPSAAETFGLAAVEAAQAGVPVVANDLSVLREVLNVDGEPCALFAKAKDPDAFGARVDQIFKDHAGTARMVELGRRLAAHYSVSAMVGAYAKLIAEKSAPSTDAAASRTPGAVGTLHSSQR